MAHTVVWPARDAKSLSLGGGGRWMGAGAFVFREASFLLFNAFMRRGVLPCFSTCGSCGDALKTRRVAGK